MMAARYTWVPHRAPRRIPCESANFSHENILQGTHHDNTRPGFGGNFFAPEKGTSHQNQPIHQQSDAASFSAPRKGHGAILAWRIGEKSGEMSLCPVNGLSGTPKPLELHESIFYILELARNHEPDVIPYLSYQFIFPKYPSDNRKTMKTTLPIIVIATAITLLSGCATPVHKMTAQQFKDKKTYVRRDDFEKETTVFSMTHYFAGGRGPRWNEGYHFYAEKPDNGKISYTFVLLTGYTGGWRFWKSATDQNGKRFSLQQYSTERGYDGQMWEWCAVDLSREYLESIRETGIAWRFYDANSNTITTTLLPQIIDGFLMKVDEVLK